MTKVVDKGNNKSKNTNKKYPIYNDELYSLYDSLLSCDNLKGIMFVKALNNITYIIEEELKSHNKMMETYHKERITLCEKHSNLDEEGKAIQIPNVDGKSSTYDIIDQKAFDIALEKLKVVHGYDKYEAWLKEECELVFPLINDADIPKEITAGQRRGIFKFIKQ